ncbi:UNVERIFIED_CONTAM: hypothetical protein K2H54_050043 [Gekko kuhli]
MTVFQPLQVKIIPVTVPASPILNGSTCYSVVSEVLYEVEFNGIHGIQNISVQFKVDNIYGNPKSILQQSFSLSFWNKNHSFTKWRSGNPGYISGAPLVALYNGTQQYDGHCMIPISLDIQVIWAQVGLLSNPQAQVLGARYLYICKPLKSLGTYMDMLPLTTTVAFTDVTKWPEPPRSQPRAYWKLPFDFFFPFKMALSGVGSSSGSQAGTLLVTLTLYGVFVS